MENEVWKACEPTGRYEVSDLGRVRFRRKDGTHRMCTLLKGNRQSLVCVANRTISLPRLVATTFGVFPPDVRAIIEHINGDIRDNRLSNLRWTTREKMWGKVSKKMATEGKSSFVRGDGVVLWFDKNNDLIDVFHSAAEAERVTGKSAQVIYSTISGKVNRTEEGWFFRREKEMKL